jgi:hypothetical protein
MESIKGSITNGVDQLKNKWKQATSELTANDKNMLLKGAIIGAGVMQALHGNIATGLLVAGIGVYIPRNRGTTPSLQPK